MQALLEDLRHLLQTLDESLWERRISEGRLDRWLENFDSAPDPKKARLHALYLASQFLYFGDREIRALLHAVYRDLFKYPIIAELRRAGAKAGSRELEDAFSQLLARTRFLALGNPSESGSHLLYFFRQENGLSKKLFVAPHQLVTGFAEGSPRLALQDVEQYVFVDDFCGTGRQVKTYSREIVAALRSAAKAASARVTVSYFPLVATETGLGAVRRAKIFDRADAAILLDNSYRCFSAPARQFTSAHQLIDKTYARELCTSLGKGLCPAHPLGYGPGQLLLGFHHNTPNNTLPIMWADGVTHGTWRPLFRRYGKVTLGSTGQ